MVGFEKRIERLKKALAEGKISRDLYDANMAKIRKEMEEEGADGAPGPQTKPCPICDALNPVDAFECVECGMEIEMKKPEPAVPASKPPETDDDLLADLLKKDGSKADDIEYLDLDSPAKAEPEAEELELFLDSVSMEDGEDEAPAVPPAKAEADDDDLLLDDLYDSLVIREEPLKCPLCGTEHLKGTTMCSNCGAIFTEEGQLVEEVSVETLADSIEDGLAELEGLAEEIVSEEVPEVAEEEMGPPPVTAPAPPGSGPEIDESEIPDRLEITEESLPKAHLMGFRLLDIVIFGTAVALIVIFTAFGLYDMSNMTSATGGIFFGVALSGFIITFFLFRLSASAIAEGDRHFKAGKYVEAMGFYDRAIRFSNKPASAWTSKGVAQKRLGDYGAALRSHNMALKLNPMNEIAWCNKGDLLFRMNRPELALECYENALDINKRYAIAWNNKGAALAKLGRFEEAKLCEDNATRLRPRYAAAWVNKGEILAKMGRRQEAIVCYRRARKIVGI